MEPPPHFHPGGLRLDSLASVFILIHLDKLDATPCLNIGISQKYEFIITWQLELAGV